MACEKELKRSGVAQFLRPGDVVWDCALGSEGNVGRLIWDGGYLIVRLPFMSFYSVTFAATLRGSSLCVLSRR